MGEARALGHDALRSGPADPKGALPKGIYMPRPTSFSRMLRAALALSMVVALVASGCISQGDGVQPASAGDPSMPDPSVNATAPASVMVHDRFTGGIGTPTLGPIPFVFVTALGDNGEPFDVPKGTAALRVEANWTTPVPARFELHLQSPSVEVHTAAPGPTDMTSTASMTVEGNIEPGEWVVFITSQGAAVSVEWAARIDLLT